MADISDHPTWKAGVASTIITPSESMWLAGWAARREPSSGTASELYARALALEDPRGSQFVIVTVDLIAVTRALSDAVAEKIHARFGLSRDRLLFNASHTHTGPEIRPDKVPFFDIPEQYACKISPYVETIGAKLVETISAALTALAPAILSVGCATVGFAFNRRSGGGPTDHDVPILRVADLSGKARAILFGYACHNLTLPPEFAQNCAEYAGFACQFLEDSLSGATALFMSGAGADQDPRQTGTLDLARAHGRELADSISNALIKDMRDVRGHLRVKYENTDLQFEPVPSPEILNQNLESSDAPLRKKSRFLLDALAAGQTFDVAYPCPIQIARFGKELLLIAMGGEPVVQYALDFKAQFAGPLVWVAGYCNDMFGYIPTRKIQREGGYEAGRAMLWSALPAPYDQTTEDRVKNAVSQIVDRAKSS